MNKNLLLTASIIGIIGLLIISYDYPQIYYLENLTEKSLDQSEKLWRIQLEFSIGISLLIASSIAILASIKKH